VIARNHSSDDIEIAAKKCTKQKRLPTN
jgi:hypothetical protein